jgi:hypothetical protein
VLGGGIGAIAGYRGGAVDVVVSRMLDVLIAFPVLVLALAVAESLGPSKLHTIFALSFFSVPAFARISRAATLQLREQTFILAARLSGTSGPAHPAAARLAEHHAPADHVRPARDGRDHHHRGRAELLRPRRPAARAELGEHDRRRPERALGRAAARADPQRGAVHHGAGRSTCSATRCARAGAPA